MLADFNLPIDDYFGEHAQTITQEQPRRSQYVVQENEATSEIHPCANNGIIFQLRYGVNRISSSHREGVDGGIDYIIPTKIIKH